MMFIDNELIIFIDEALSKMVELLSRLVSPPINEVSMLVILAACKAQQLYIHTRAARYMPFAFKIWKLQLAKKFNNRRLFFIVSHGPVSLHHVFS